ncbi:MAG: glycosyltransferase family 1 protein [Saprospirales bacterium]|nr:glycosyltransferase family 1 protein [Saprospirales bacterium]
MKKTHHFLFVTIDGGGNLQPVLGLAKRLAGRGHRITVLSEPCLEELIRALGFDYIPFENHFIRTDRTADIFQDWKGNPLTDPTMDNIVFGPAKTVAAETERALKRSGADMLVADCLLPTALIPAEAMGISSVIAFHFPEYMPGPNRPPGILGLQPAKGPFGRLRDRLLGRVFHLALGKYLPLVNEVRESYSLGKLDRATDLLDRADLRLIQTLRNFDFPIEPAPANVRYTGPVLDDPDWVGGWTNPWADNDPRPLVVVSLSSTFQNQAQVIQHAIHALGGLDVRGLVTLGPAIDPNGLDVPENVVVMQSAPHSQVFPQTDLVITHAGHGTIMRALAHGLPLICIPMGRDQKDNAVKVALRGCGIKLSPKSGPEKIRQAVQQILGDPSFVENASRMQAEVRSSAEKDLAVGELEGLLEKETVMVGE